MSKKLKTLAIVVLLIGTACGIGEFRCCGLPVPTCPGSPNCP